ncbi:hypothetical protein BDN72DRAFT_849815 [Pluteus cervinus]|uniref:Uncharacterized protein n=1 Tax=Pluteus cervinus TaxID=181527 RepID=A0ACD3A6X8_9AGAR|nr:hypothetical protein BDN72DRAFT_849815 [Pluteus cervinus]
MACRASTALLLLSLFFNMAPVRGIPMPMPFLQARQYGSSASTAPSATMMSSISTGTSASVNFKQQNALDAQKLNAKFATMQTSDSCQAGDMACIKSSFAQCVGGKWESTPCSTGTICVALPLVNKPGTSLVCDTLGDAVQRFSDAGVSGGLTGSDTGNSTTIAGSEGEEDGEMECDDDDEGSTTSQTDDQDGELECDDDEETTVSASSTVILSASASVNSASTPVVGTPNTLAAAVASSTGLPSYPNYIALVPSASSVPPSTVLNLNKRQFLPTSSSTSAVATAIPTPVTSSASVIFVTVSSSSSAQPVFTALPSSIVTVTPGASEPTGAITTTVTLIATVTVTASNCEATSIGGSFPSVQTIIPQISTVTPSSPSASTIVVLAAGSAAPFPVSASLPNAAPNTILPIAPSVIELTAVSQPTPFSQSSSPPLTFSTSSTTSRSPFSFTFGPSPTYGL